MLLYTILEEIKQEKRGLHPCVTCTKKVCKYKHNCGLVQKWHFNNAELYQRYGKDIIMAAYEIAELNWKIEDLKGKRVQVEEKIERIINSRRN